MCPPVLMAIGTAVSVAGTVAAGNAQAAAYKNEAALMERQAQIRGQQGSFQADRTRERGARVLGQQRAAFAEMGVTGGSVMDVAGDSIREIETDVAAIRYGTQVEQDNLRFKGAMARSNARSARQGGVLGGIAQGIQGATQIATYLASPYGSVSF